MAVLRHRRRGRTSRRRVRLANAGAATAALLLAVAVGWHAAWAGFSDTTQPGGLTITTATLSLSDDDAGTAFFTATDLRPGATGSRCLTVTSTSTVPTTVRVRASSRTTGTLSGQLRVTVDAGTGPCTGFVSGGSPGTAILAQFPTTWSAGLTSWRTTGTAGESRAYQVTYTLPASATTGSNGTASIALTWEAQS